MMTGKKDRKKQRKKEKKQPCMEIFKNAQIMSCADS